eukprot:UN29620
MMDVVDVADMMTKEKELKTPSLRPTNSINAVYDKQEEVREQYSSYQSKLKKLMPRMSKMLTTFDEKIKDCDTSPTSEPNVNLLNIKETDVSNLLKTLRIAIKQANDIIKK